MSIRTSVKQMLVRQQDKKYEAELAKLRVTYAQWAGGAGKKDCGNVVTEIGERGRSCGIRDLQAAERTAGGKCCGADQCVFCEGIRRQEIVYGDEDLLSENGERVIPWFKPCWAPDTYRAFFYVGSVVAVRSRLLQKLGEPGL